ncbi:TFIIB-type zinc ribbon-containing protein [Candidatus Bathycorpusculum sp.]|uniref:TFIIB-type zinc ribbon-containing protein n=1 Tax=Candidatus Bathycorpusculum sp. TaxID=2994959 RepID=UPI002833D937|nr:hypothetical protein [Candidatus Termitimicrobium sp.]
MCETETCSECSSTNIIDDNTKGEIVCIKCGLVINKAEPTPPQDRTPPTTTKNTKPHPIAYTNPLGTKTPANKRTEISVAFDIHYIIPQIGLPLHMQEMAIAYMRKLYGATKKHNPKKIRFTKNELTTISIWTTIKQQNYPLSSDEYLKKLAPYIKIKNLMKIEKRASYFIPNQNRTTNIPLVTGHITKIAAQLETDIHIESAYANKISTYAIQIIHTNPGVITSRRANLVAAAALLAADHLLAKRLRLIPLAKVANTGTGTIAKLAKTCMRYAPALPPESAAIKFSHNLLKK